MENRLSITPGFCFLWALCLLTLPLRWAMGAVFAAFVHELAHCIAVLFFGGQILTMKLGGHGAVMKVTPMTWGKEAICVLAGPIGSFSLLLTAEFFPEAAICGLAQGIYNLLPFYPLDGGRFLRILFSESISIAAEVFFGILLAGFGLWMVTQNSNPGLFILLLLWFPLIRGKITCKESKQAVQ